MLTEDKRACWFYIRATKESLRGLKAAVPSAMWRELRTVGIHPPCWVRLTLNDEAPCFVYLRRRPTALEFPVLKQCFPWMRSGFVARARIEPASRFARWMRRDRLVEIDGTEWTRRGKKPTSPAEAGEVETPADTDT